MNFEPISAILASKIEIKLLIQINYLKLLNTILNLFCFERSANEAIVIIIFNFGVHDIIRGDFNLLVPDKKQFLKFGTRRNR